mmetsp:Transcript_11695/g.10324  ORF Transcript_11695/g.10324 Transcript_11695/m.10324 type:complete len:117 (+) Transcript_11695:249-599(+)
MSIKQEERKYLPRNNNPHKRLRIRSAQPRRPNSNNRGINSRNGRYSNLPHLEFPPPVGLTPINKVNNYQRRTASRGSNGSRQSRNSNRSRRSARPPAGERLDPIPAHILRHNNYLI